MRSNIIKNLIISTTILLFLGVLFLLTGCGNERDVNVSNFGAKAGDSKYDNSGSIQKAIDQVSNAGGGKVTIPAGDFYTQPIELKSGVDLHLDEGAKLIGVDNIEVYTKYTYKKFSSIIFAEKQENISVSGTGTIDGQGGAQAFQVEGDPAGRPMIILFHDCKDVAVTDVTLRDSAHWVQYYTACERVQIRGIKVHSQCNFNNDGIDIESKDVVVSDCIIDSEDDAICLKGVELCENVAITNCVAAANCNGIKFGTGSSKGYRNVTISNVALHHASEDNRRHWSIKYSGITAPTTIISGIAIEVADGGIAENININNISMTDVQTPIFIRLERREVDEGQNTYMKGINISNVTAISESMMTSSITGVPGLYPENITLSNIDITAPGGGTADMASISVPEAESTYPENRMLGTTMPASGFYLRHARNVTLNNIRFHFRAPDARPLIIKDDCANIVQTP
ncbi:MAG: glycosyl hydrolase family 28 protein [Coriobacteriia bacterium]|nr:glycosyl hydrolase family 28 protein [Coriobacteriia bacterium]